MSWTPAVVVYWVLALKWGLQGFAFQKKEWLESQMLRFISRILKGSVGGQSWLLILIVNQGLIVDDNISF